MNRRSSATTAFLGATLVGVAGGLLLARQHDRAHRHDLFSGRVYRRFAALGWLAAEDDPENLPLLHDYLAWEPVPSLRQRAERIVAALEGVA